jgi:hypothetical protein
MKRTNLVTELLADSHSLLNMGKNHFYQLLNIPGLKNISWPEMHTPEPKVPVFSTFDFNMVTEKFEGYKAPCTDQIVTELIKTDKNHYTNY